MATSTTTTINQGTQRKDNWLLQPILAGFVLVFFGVYALFRAASHDPSILEGTNYISPLYTPYIPHLLHSFGVEAPAWMTSKTLNDLAPWFTSPAFLTIWIPIGFRGTCYFYRRVYYRSFFTAPTACAVDTAKSPLINLIGCGKNYTGERKFPMVLMNMHRYFFYLAALFIVLHAIDVVTVYFLPGFTGPRIGLGSLVLTLDVLLLAGYAFGCHSWRHLIGGRVDSFSGCCMGEARHEAYQRQGFLNRYHGLFGWVSLGWLLVADIYIYLVAHGQIQDFVLYQNTWKGIFG